MKNGDSGDDHGNLEGYNVMIVEIGLKKNVN